MALTSGLSSGLRPGLYSGLENVINPDITYVATGTHDTAAAAVAPAWPSHQAGDIGLLIIHTSNESIATPSGWTSAATQQGIGTAATAGSVRIGAFWARATSSAMAAASVADSGDHQSGKIHVFRGCVPSGDPVNISAGDTAASSTSVSIPGATTTLPGCLVVAICGDGTDALGNRYSSVANSSLTNVTERDDYGFTAGTGGGVGVFTGTKVAAGAYSATTATVGPASAQARISIALRK